MNVIIPFDIGRTAQIKNENDLPKHITFEQFQKIYNELKGISQIMWGLLWETGGRITAVLSTKWDDINYNSKELTLLVQKKKKVTTIKIPLSNAMINDLRNYQLYIKPEPNDFIFDTTKYNRERSGSGRLTRQGAWGQVNGWGRKWLKTSIHPHMLRHGLAIYLLGQNVPIPVIAARLGHSNAYITQSAYLVITPELQRQMMAHVPMR